MLGVTFPGHSILLHVLLFYLINIHWLSVDFDFDLSKAGHAEGVILSCCMIILPSGVIST